MPDILTTLRRPLGKIKRKLLGTLRQTSPKPGGRQYSPSDLFIVTYPRSGTGWIIALVCDLLVQMNGYETTTTSEALHLARKSTEKSYTGDLPDTLSFPFRVVKSHEIEDIPRPRVLYLFRRPEDALSSYYHFHFKEGGKRLELVQSMSPDQFALHYLDEWCQHVQAAIDARTSGKNDIFVISYERMHEDTPTLLRAAADFMGIHPSDRMIQRAVHNHTFAASRASEEAVASEGHNFYYRKGVVGGASEDFSAETLAHIQQVAGPVYERACKLLDI